MGTEPYSDVTVDKEARNLSCGQRSAAKQGPDILGHSRSIVRDQFDVALGDLSDGRRIKHVIILQRIFPQAIENQSPVAPSSSSHLMM